MDFFTKFLKGLAIGAGGIAPGVSGGALSVMFGLYDKITYAIANFTKNTKKKIIYFLPIGIGAGLGVILFSRFMNYLFTYYELGTLYLFTGLMVGSLPTVQQHANKKGFKKKYLISFFMCFLIGLFFTYIEVGYKSNDVLNNNGILNQIIYGVIIGFGTIIPGISASVILLYIGAYDFVLCAVSCFQIGILFFLGLGFLISIILFSKIINKLFEKAYGYTNYGVFGFTLGSIISIFPGIELSIDYLKYFIIFMIGCITTYSFSKAGKSKLRK